MYMIEYNLYIIYVSLWKIKERNNSMKTTITPKIKSIKIVSSAISPY